MAKTYGPIHPMLNVVGPTMSDGGRHPVKKAVINRLAIEMADTRDTAHEGTRLSRLAARSKPSKEQRVA